MDASIKQALHAIEVQHQVRVLYACEAGSRAWGIESADSDYDVRFIYAHPSDRYLDLDAPRDVIELAIANDLDISGWDIFKALRLLRKSNPTLLEWLFSPMIYIENSPAIETMRHIARSSFAPKTNLLYHYEHMASTNYRQYIKEKAPVIIKKYLYVLRPLIVLLYLEQRGSLPPTVNFPEVLANVTLSASITEADEVRKHIEELIARKRTGDELGMAAPNVVLNRFIAERLEHRKAQEFSDHGDRVAMQRETNEVLQKVLGLHSF